LFKFSRERIHLLGMYGVMKASYWLALLKETATALIHKMLISHLEKLGHFKQKEKT
jgi:hypothetical protein